VGLEEGAVSSSSRSWGSESRDRLIESHLPLVRALARRYAGRGEALEDLVQVGTVGLIKASKRFDPRRGVSFASFAAPAVEGEIRRHLAERGPSVRIPRALQKMTGQLRRSRVELAAQLGRSPTLEELASALGVDEKDVERGLQAERARDPVPIADDDSSDKLVDPEPLAGSDDRMLLQRAMSALDDRERRIVFLRFHADMTEGQIARVIGVSQAHVSRLLASALAKLRDRIVQEEEPADRPDIAAERAISRRPRQESAAKRARRTERKTRIDAVAGSQQEPELGRYLGLPYHVVVRSERDDNRTSWIAAVEELPGCQVRAATAEEAIARVRPAMKQWLSEALRRRSEIPRPWPEGAKQKASSSHSGRLLLRMPSELHRELSRAAEREQVSLNRFITDALAEAVADETEATSSEGAPATAPERNAAPTPGRHGTRALTVALATNLVVVVVAGLAALALLILAVQRGI
jgi:RNA polymerase sigma-B factor